MDERFTLQFDNTYTRLPRDFYTRVRPNPLRNTHLISFNSKAAEMIGLDCAITRDQSLLNALAGMELLPGMDPIATVYAGHQFGTFVPQLGDGRAILLGEARNHLGESWDLQLKGAGITPYSRDGDGRAVLRSTIREYLCSEAMHGLGVPTTRALCMFGSDEEVYRESIESGALLVRMAPSHVRFGSFEFFYYRGQHDAVQQLADYIIEHHYPELAQRTNKYTALLKTVIASTAELIAQWQAVGFAHGVMNTDNMSVLGLTIDYGPYGFMEAYDPGYICNHSDYYGRYAFARQPDIAKFNLSCLAQTLLPLIDRVPEAAAEQALALLSEFEPLFNKHYETLCRAKLGLQQSQLNDHTLYASLLTLLDQNNVDYTRFFRALNRFTSDKRGSNAELRDMFIDREAFDRWAKQYRRRLVAESSIDSQRKTYMDGINPKYVLRNYMAETAIRKASEDKDYSEIDRLLNLLHTPFAEHPDMEHYAGEPPDWAHQIEVSCSS
ncbi:MAG: YdiU family protein [Gammaproteobacteria bacterium]|nr:YdiU family protein [Gammaproteobacteria bacterium]